MKDKVRFESKLAGDPFVAVIRSGKWVCKDRAVQDYLNAAYPPAKFPTFGQPVGYTAARKAHKKMGGKLHLEKVTHDELPLE